MTNWSRLRRRAKAFRVAHAAWSVIGLASLSYIWACLATRRRDRLLWVSVACLSVEGAALAVGRGDCPCAPLQERWGDPVPLFELVLPPRAAKAAIPLLFAATAAGLVALVARGPRSMQEPALAGLLGAAGSDQLDRRCSQPSTWLRPIVDIASDIALLSWRDRSIPPDPDDQGDRGPPGTSRPARSLDGSS